MVSRRTRTTGLPASTRRTRGDHEKGRAPYVGLYSSVRAACHWARSATSQDWARGTAAFDVPACAVARFRAAVLAQLFCDFSQRWLQDHRGARCSVADHPPPVLALGVLFCRAWHLNDPAEVSPRSSASSMRIRSSKSRRSVFARFERRSTGMLAASWQPPPRRQARSTLSSTS